MALGPGKYDSVCVEVWEKTKADGVVLIVFGGDRGHGFSVVADAVTIALLPDILRNTAKQIEESCTGRGENRKERNAHIYSQLVMYPRACLVKAADRLANLRSSRLEEFDVRGPGLRLRRLKMYQKEHTAFMQIVGPHIPRGLRDALNDAAKEDL
jgi:hypothetical protein